MTDTFGRAAPVIDVLGRRASLDIVAVLKGGALGERALLTRLSAYNGSVVTQRVEDLRRIGAVEVVPESGELRLSAHGRRLLGILEGVEAWAASAP